MNDDLNKKTVLVLNRNWQAIDITHPAMAFCQMVTNVATAMDISGRDHMVPVKWEDWINLEIREDDQYVGLSGDRKVRVPTVIVLSTFNKVPMKRPKFSASGVYDRDGGRCQYTDRKLAPGEGNFDHVFPDSKGGAKSWDNIVLADRRVNTKKANRTPEQAGLKLLRRPVAPKAMPVTSYLRNHFGIPDWDNFHIPRVEAKEA